MRDNNTHRRREILKATGGLAGLGLLAGCSSGDGGDGSDDGSDGGDSGSDGGSGSGSDGGSGSGGDGGSGSGGDGNSGPFQINAAGADQGSGTYQMTTAYQSAVSDRLSNVDMTVQATQGSVANIQRMAQGDFNFGMVPAFQVDQHLSEVETSVQPHQGWQTTIAHQYVITFPEMSNKSIETWGDLPGSNFWAYSPGFSGYATTKAVMEEAGLWSEVNRVPVGTSDIVGAIQEGRVDAAVAFGVSFLTLVPWLTELDSLDIEIRHVPMTQSVKDAIGNINGLPYVQSDPYGWENHDLSGPLDSFILASQTWFGPDVPEQVAYDMVKMAHENSESIKEAAPLLLPYHENKRYLNRDMASEDYMPFHPGTKRYFQEQDIWPVPADQ